MCSHATVSAAGTAEGTGLPSLKGMGTDTDAGCAQLLKGTDQSSGATGTIPTESTSSERAGVRPTRRAAPQARAAVSRPGSPIGTIPVPIPIHAGTGRWARSEDQLLQQVHQLPGEPARGGLFPQDRQSSLDRQSR